MTPRKPPPPGEEAAGPTGPPSKSARKREHEALQDLARRAIEAPPGRLDRLALGEGLAQAIRDGRRLPPSSARARHIRYLARLFAGDPAGAGVVATALSADRAAHAQEVARLHRVEQWRDRLLAEGDAALADLLARHPAIDAGTVRDLLRQAGRDAGSARHAATVRRLFRLLRAAVEGDAAAAE